MTTDDVMQYADVAEWQQELLASDDTKAGRDYWRDYCRNVDFAALESVLSAFEGRSIAQFSPDVVTKQVELAQSALPSNSSLPDFLLACWQVFLSRMTGRPSVTVGCQFDGRSYAELANALGVLAKYLPLQVTCSETTTFKDVLDQVQHDSADFQNWQDSFSWSNAGLPLGLEQGPALPLAFDFAEIPDAQVFGDLRVTSVRQQVAGERFRLKLSARRKGERVSAGVSFRFGLPRALDGRTVE